MVKYVMLAIGGTYENGFIKLDKEVLSENPVRVIVTFLEDIVPDDKKRMNLFDFSFSQSRKITEDYKDSFSDILIEERREKK